jgi:hypothetical protein
MQSIVAPIVQMMPPEARKGIQWIRSRTRRSLILRLNSIGLVTLRTIAISLTKTKRNPPQSSHPRERISNFTQTRTLDARTVGAQATILKAAPPRTIAATERCHERRAPLTRKRSRTPIGGQNMRSPLSWPDTCHRHLLARARPPDRGAGRTDRELERGRFRRVCGDILRCATAAPEVPIALRVGRGTCATCRQRYRGCRRPDFDLKRFRSVGAV